MKILMIGSGGREHALIKKLLESPKCEKLYCAPGNGGISRDAETVAINVMDKEGMVRFAKDNAIDLVPSVRTQTPRLLRRARCSPRT